MLKKLNLPNKLTLLRIVLVPVFIICMVVFSVFKVDVFKWLALVTFVVASLTDFVDGKISRKFNLVTNFGKLFDPLADKLLVNIAFVMLTGAGLMPAWITAIMIFRDLFIDTVRMFAAKQNVTFAAKLTGKIRTMFTMSGVSLMLIDMCINDKAGLFSFANMQIMSSMLLFVNVVSSILIVFAVIFTFISLVDYVRQCKKFINVEE